MEYSNLENAMNNLMPLVIKLFLLAGIVAICIGIIVGLYRMIIHRGELRSMAYVIVSGALLSIVALMIAFLAHFKLNYSSFKWQIPFSTIIGIVILAIATKIANKTTKEENNTDL